MENIKDFIDNLTPENFIEETKQFRDFRNYDKNKDIIKLLISKEPDTCYPDPAFTDFDELCHDFLNWGVHWGIDSDLEYYIEEFKGNKKLKNYTKFLQLLITLFNCLEGDTKEWKTEQIPQMIDVIKNRLNGLTESEIIEYGIVDEIEDFYLSPLNTECNNLGNTLEDILNCCDLTNELSFCYYKELYDWYVTYNEVKYIIEQCQEVFQKD
jgi:hypothetical protein